MENINNNLENDFESNQDEGQFFIEFLNTIRRQKKYFLSVSLLTFLLTGLVLLQDKKFGKENFR